MFSFYPQRAIAVLLCICMLSAGCTTTRELPVPAAPSSAESLGIKQGDKVIVTLKSGEVRSFRVAAIEADAIAGKKTRVAFADIQFLERKKFSGKRTAALAGSVVLVLAGAYYGWRMHSIKNSD